MTVLGAAIGLTIWFTVISLLVLFLMLFRVPVPDALTVVTVVAVCSYFLLPVRWVLILTLLIRTVRAKPFRMLPRAPLVQVTFVVLVQVVVGLMSFAGWWGLWSETGRTGDHVFGFVLHAGVPSMMVLFLARRGGQVRPAVSSRASAAS